MSLKGFHVVFIVVSIALAIVMAIWALAQWTSPAGSAGHLATGLASLGAAAGLTLYAVRFVRKARRIGLE